jgi:hypothetical protein
LSYCVKGPFGRCSPCLRTLEDKAPTNGTGIAIPHTSYDQSHEQNALSKVRPAKLALKEKFMKRKATTTGADLWWKKGSSNDREASCLLHQYEAPQRSRSGSATVAPPACCRSADAPSNRDPNQGCSWTPIPTGFHLLGWWAKKMPSDLIHVWSPSRAITMPTSNIVAVLAMSLRHVHPSFETIGRVVCKDGAVIGLFAPLAICHQRRRHAGNPVG